MYKLKDESSLYDKNKLLTEQEFELIPDHHKLLFDKITDRFEVDINEFDLDYDEVSFSYKKYIENAKFKAESLKKKPTKVSYITEPNEKGPFDERYNIKFTDNSIFDNTGNMPVNVPYGENTFELKSTVPHYYDQKTNTIKPIVEDKTGPIEYEWGNNIKFDDSEDEY